MRKAIATLLLVGFAMNASAQGCSDAGFCSIGNLNHQSADSQPNFKQYLKLTMPAGVGDEDVFVFTPGLEYGFQKQRWQFSGKVTGNYASGNLGNATGPGDVFLSSTYQLPSSSKWKTSVTIGTKLPLNQGNLKENNLSLPMQYQSSLGTIDLISGVALKNEKWKVAAGWQQPLTGINRNNFLPQYWPDGKAAAFPSTNDFNRKGDVLLRTSYRFIKNAKWSLEGGLLGIYHLGEDTYIDANISNKPIAIKGSAGLTLNATASLERMLNKRWALGLVGGIPLVVRDVRPDGLTRSFVVAPHIIYQF
ncbi:MAG: hypothetical protein V4717_13945 [Bacteroidota bacterium]